MRWQKEQLTSHLHDPPKSTTNYVILDFLEKTNSKKRYKKISQKLKKWRFWYPKYFFYYFNKMIQFSIKFHKTIRRNAKNVWHAKITEFPNRNRKNTKNTTKKNKLLMHTKIHISSVFTKIVLTFQKTIFKKYRVFFS